MLREEPWFVEQAQGAALGYRIVPYDPLGAQKGQDPSLIAFRVPLRPGRAVTGFRTVDAGGIPLAGSERQIRVIAPPPAEPVLPLLALVPLGVMAFVLVRRAGRYRR